MFYTSAPSFQGTDNFEVEVITARGTGRKVRLNVNGQVTGCLCAISRPRSLGGRSNFNDRLFDRSVSVRLHDAHELLQGRDVVDSPGMQRLLPCWSLCSASRYLTRPAAQVRFRAERQSNAHSEPFRVLTRCMVRPCGARRFVDLGDAVLHQCIRSLIGAYCGSRPSWISARVRSRYRTGLNGPFGSPVFARAGKTDPPFRLVLSQTSVGKRCLLRHR